MNRVQLPVSEWIPAGEAVLTAGRWSEVSGGEGCQEPRVSGPVCPLPGHGDAGRGGQGRHAGRVRLCVRQAEGSEAGHGAASRGLQPGPALHPRCVRQAGILKEDI